MATARARASTPLLLLLLLGTLLFAAAAASSWHEDREREREPWRCVRRCEERPRHERARCVQECRRREEDERQRHDDELVGRHGKGSGDERSEEHEQEQSQRPYVFGRRSFRRVVKSEQGSVWALRPFDEASKLLRGIRDYRVAVLEASPRSFIVPSHTDAHCICYVAQGEGVVTTIENGERQSYTVKEGDVFVAPAGTVTYLANTDGRRKLVIAKILHTISAVPGKFEFFFGPGGKNPESILSSFSKSVQRAAYKTSSERLERLFGKQDKGVIVRASEEQVRELRRQASEGGHGPHWPLPPFGESRGPFSLLDQRPSIANRHGQLYEADARSYRDLAEHDIRVSLANISAGSMSAPYYNSRSIKVAYVLDGEGHVEIVCPHLSQQEEQGRRRSERGRGRRGESESESESEEEQAGQGYRTIRARVSRGTAFVVPVGHPVVHVASRGSNLQIVCFEIRADKNEKVFLAGANNVLKKLDNPAKELAFAAKAREVDEVLGAQRDQGFLAGPEETGRREEQEEEEREGRRGRKEREEEEEEREGRRGRKEREEEKKEREGRRGREQEREREEEREGRRGRGRREELAETFLRMATARL
ncbi:unnamed protein product [Urochloa decumbens]|uniref:Cupin type-1 domain-containing protein n=1 Tax=Urochloa decumbens TaxID=240449 RepID=A0ABC9HAK0_9POAL